MGETTRKAMRNAQCVMRNDSERVESRVAFRRMTEDDAPALVAIERKCFDKRDAWRRSYFISAAMDWQSEYLVAEVDGKIVGCAGAEISPDAAEIQTISVDPDYHGQGIGTQLFAKLLAAIRERGATLVYLEVRPSNTPAIELYEKFGFSGGAQIENFYRNEDALIMFKAF